MSEKQLKYHSALTRSTQSGAAQDFFNIQNNPPISNLFAIILQTD